MKFGNQSKHAWFVIVIFGLLGLFMVGLAFYPFLETAQARRRYVPCEAVIQSHELEQYTVRRKYGSSRRTRSRIVYLYRYEGVQRSGSRVDFGSKNLLRSRQKFFPGRKMPCFVDSTAPENAVLFLSPGSFNYPACIMGGLFVVFCAGMFFADRIARKKQKKNEENLKETVAESQQYPLPESVRISRCACNPNRTNALSPIFRQGKDGCWRLWRSIAVFWIVLPLGLVLAGIGVPLFPAEGSAAWIFVGIGALIVGASVWGIVAAQRNVWTFSPTQKAFWRDARDLRLIADETGLQDYTRFDYVAAIQLVAKICRGAKGAEYHVMELNLVCRDGNRIPLVDSGSINTVIGIAKELSGLLGVRIVAVD